MDGWSDFQGVNAGFVAELYERFRRDPQSVDAETRAFFDKAPPPEITLYGSSRLAAAAVPTNGIVAAVSLTESIRKFGHLAARLDPLGSDPPGDPSLLLKTYGISDDDLERLPANLIAGPIARGCSNALEVIQALRKVYCSHSGYDYAHLRSPDEREWLTSVTEGGAFRPPRDPINEIAILERLTQEEAFELFLHRTFPGRTRFSIEGLDMLIPIIDEIIRAAANDGVRQILIGIGHRGRLNVLAHVLNKPYAQILAEFRDPVKASKHRDDLGWTGDVKYHAGARRSVTTGEIPSMVISMAPNPSHLEMVYPVVIGMARAGGTRVDDRGASRFDPGRILPVLIHGDAVFPAEGVVAETLNMYRLPGYHTGGAVHIIGNNQIGFTTPPEEGRSTLFASDLARGFRIPIVHVNADDPEASIEAARMAYAYRAHFHNDFLIDLVGYRRYGHNEGDEPGFTQPLMYQKIAEHSTVRQLWVKCLLSRGVIRESLANELVLTYMTQIQSVFNSLEAESSLTEPIPASPQPGTARQTATAMPLEHLRELNHALRPKSGAFGGWIPNLHSDWVRA